MSTEPSYFNAYENFSLTRTPAGVLTVRLHTNGGPITFTGATHSQFPRVLEDIAFDRDNQVMVLTGTGDSFMDAIDGPSLGDLTKPMGADVEYIEGRRIVQRLVDLEMPIVAAVNGSASIHSEYALLADVVIASDTTVFSDFPRSEQKWTAGTAPVATWPVVRDSRSGGLGDRRRSAGGRERALHKSPGDCIIAGGSTVAYAEPDSRGPGGANACSQSGSHPGKP
jgi:hypothetical protein